MNIMAKKIFSLSLAGLTALSLVACGGGGSASGEVGVTPSPSPAPSPAPVTVPFKWASLSQLIPAGQTSLDLQISKCADNNNGGAAVTGNLKMTITSDGDFVYSRDGAEQMLMQDANRTLAYLSIADVTGQSAPQVEAQLISPERQVQASSARVGTQAIKADREEVSLSGRGITVIRTARKLNVSCTLPAVVLANGSFTLAALKKELVPAVGQGKVFETVGAGGNFIAYDTTTQNGTLKIGADKASATDISFTSSNLTQVTQRYAKTPESKWGYPVTKWVELDLQRIVGNSRTSDRLVMGQDETQPAGGLVFAASQARPQ